MIKFPAMPQQRFRARSSRAALVPALCVLALCLTHAACGGATRPADASLPSPPALVATVGGRPVTAKLYEMYLRNGREGLGLDSNTEEGRRKLDLLREGIVSELIDRAVITAEAERRGLSLTPEQMAEAERRAVAQLGGERRYDDYLASHKLTREEYREVIKTEAYGELLRARMREGLSVTDEEVAKYYESHRDDLAFRAPERVTASHVLVAARPNIVSQELQSERGLSGDALAAAVREEMSKRRRRAEDVRRRAAGGADFAGLAREFSDDAATRARGGDLGSFGRDTHTRAFDEAAFALGPGAVSEVVETEFGFHVIKVASRAQARAQTLEEAAPEIRRRLLAEREAATLKAWLAEARRKSDVRVSEPYRVGALRHEFPAL